MHVIIINGSPRVKKFSNTERIIDAFEEGLRESGATSERYVISDKKNWEEVRSAYINNEEIIIALPLYVESAPGILLEFLESLPKKDTSTRISFILQGGFAEASQLHCGEEFLKRLVGYLGVSYGGTLKKGDNFGIRVVKEEDAIKITGPYKDMGKAFVKENGFSKETATKFAGPEYFSFPMRVVFQIVFKTFAKKRFAQVASEWGCQKPINYKPWEQEG